MSLANFTLSGLILGGLFGAAALALPPSPVAADHRAALVQEKKAELLTLDALKSLSSLEDRAARLKPGDVRGANLLMKRLSLVANKLNGAKDKTHPKWKEGAKRYQELQALIKATGENKQPENAGIAGLKKNAYDTYEALRKSNLATMGDPAVVKSWRDKITALRAQLAKMPDQKDREYGKTKQQIDQIESLLENGLVAYKKNQKDAKAMAHVKSVTDSVHAKYSSKGMPRGLYHPFELESSKAWAETVGRLMHKDLAEDTKRIKELRKIPEATSTRERKQRLDSLERWLSLDLPRKLKELANGGAQGVDGYIKNGLDTADFVMKTDVNDKQQVTNRLLGEGSFDSFMSRLREGLRHVEIGRAVDAGLKRTDGPNRDAQEQKIKLAMKHMQELAELAVSEVRMPKAKTTGKEYIEAAKKALAKKGHKDVKRLVISTEVKKYDQWHSTGRLSGNTITTTSYQYIWEQFQAITAEKDGDDWWLYANNFKKYSKAGPGTLTDEWYLSGRFKTTKILKENIDK